MRYRLVLPVLVLLASVPAHAAQTWNWSYDGAGISASGTFTTGDTADANGFYEVTAVSGARNGIAITGLQATHTAIPGNEPFMVDNLVRIAGPQLTVEGFGFALADGTYANPFFANFLATPGYLEYYSAPPFLSGNVGQEDSETSITFSASLSQVSDVPEPAGYAMFSLGLAILARLRTRARGTTA